MIHTLEQVVYAVCQSANITVMDLVSQY